MAQTAGFISQIPNGVLKKTEIHRCNNIVLFKPMVYMGEVKFDVTDYHVVVPSESTPDLIINNRLTHAQRRMVIAVNPGDTVSCIKDGPAKPYYSLLIKPELLREVSAEMDFTGDLIFEHTLNPFSIELLQMLKSLELELNRPDRLGLMLDSLEVQIASLLLRAFKTTMTKDTLLLQTADIYISRAMDYIHAYFDADISLNDICGEIHVSVYHFIRMFKRKVGLTPHRYLLTVRIEKAKELLDSRCYSVAETAARCGFESIPHFSDAFKKITGYSPTEYRNQK